MTTSLERKYSNIEAVKFVTSDDAEKSTSVIGRDGQFYKYIPWPGAREKGCKREPNW